MNQELSKQLYWESSYLKEIKTKIVDIRNSDILFDETIFYPGGGGQLHDTGYMKYLDHEYPIIETYKDEQGIWHKVKTKEDFPFSIGNEITLKLDWERRYNFMKAHSSQHLLTHILIEKYSCNTLKANFDEGKVEIEVDKKLNLSEIIEAFEETNKIIYQGDEVLSIITDQETYSKKYKSKIRGKTSKEETIRLIQLGSDEGYDLVGCGGTHVKNLSEIQGIVLDSVKGDFIKYFVDKTAIDFANYQRE